MATELGVISPVSDVTSLKFNETELTLGLPGESRNQKTGTKRGFSKTIDLNLGSSTGGEAQSIISEDRQLENEENCEADKSPKAKAQIVGWPPVKSSRRNMMVTIKACKYVKVAADGAPYLRKVNLEMYNSYQQLLTSLEEMFSCSTIRHMDPINGSEYVPTYEDKDGDLMLVGDVPWKMFVESCKRLRLMKSSEAIGLGPRTPSKSSKEPFSCTSRCRNFTEKEPNLRSFEV